MKEIVQVWESSASLPQREGNLTHGCLFFMRFAHFSLIAKRSFADITMKIHQMKLPIKLPVYKCLAKAPERIPQNGNIRM